MAKVILKSWREGLEKVSLTKLQVDMLGKSLKQSKSNVNLLLDGEEVVIEIDDLDLADKFLKEAEKLGVICQLLINEVTMQGSKTVIHKTK